MSTCPLLIDEPCLSRAWARSILHVLTHPGKTVSPLIVSITGFKDKQIPENATFRAAVDKALEDAGEQSPHTVANTIFPESLWRLARGNRGRLYEIYIEHYPRLQALAKRQNRRGLYFDRMIRWVPMQPSEKPDMPSPNSSAPNVENAGIECPTPKPEHSNQLEWVIGRYRNRKSIRRSALQVAIFDPERDHISDAQLGFPCLQQISFVPVGDKLVVNAFYAKQCLFKKAYGNYLGLCRLGMFMAEAMELTLDRVNITVGVAELEVDAKSGSIMKDLRQAVDSLCAPAAAA